MESLTSGQDASGAPSGAAERLVAQIADRIRGRTNVEAAFGSPCTVGDRTIIPVARVFYAFGGGGGGGSGPFDEAGNARGSGSGGGGGAGVRVVPMAVIEVTPERTRVRPIVDVAALATRAFVLAGFVAAVGLIVGRRPGRGR